ncbi:MAG: AAA family ATPase [Tenuifilaceae bacterium]|nr:AAA family ATPase [Bacteroidales bacterium]MDY0202183.1 AAA family ATPase [Tenuifilaceae bacterium]
MFTFGNATPEQLQELRDKKDEIKELRETAREEKRRLKGFEEQLDGEADRFQETVWNNYRTPNIKQFKEAFKNCGYKKTFKNRLLQEYANNSSELFSKEELLEQAKTVFGERPQAIDPLPLLDVDRLKEIEELETWETPIVGKNDVPIADLIKKLGNSDWVDQGQKFIHDETCPFCQQQTISADFKKQLEDFFNESYKNKLIEVEKLGVEYKELSEKLIEQIEKIEQREKEKSDTKIVWENFNTEIELLKSRLKESQTVMDDKLKEPSRKFSITLLTDLYDQLNERITMANTAIETHNKIVKNYNTAHRNLVQSIWKWIIEEARPTIEAHNKAISGITKAKQALEATQKETINKGIQLKKDIEELTANTTGVEFSELEMNKLLESYGFNSFRIVKSPKVDNCYQIQREDGSLVESTLSEGEVTFITFLYFYQLAKGGHEEDKVNERRVLIVDDPISSLDSNVLFVVSSLLRRYLDEIRSGEGNIVQLILLTHNSYFHKQIAIVEGRNQLRADTAFWILRKGRKWTSIESYGNENPISSTYELLWKELRSEDNKSSVLLKNAMRRILEYYFTVFGQFSNIKNLPDKFKTIEEQLICKSLISWVHDGSHDIADEIHVSDNDDTVQRYKHVFQAIFDSNGQLGHYKQMMGIEIEENKTT